MTYIALIQKELPYITFHVFYTKVHTKDTQNPIIFTMFAN